MYDSNDLYDCSDNLHLFDYENLCDISLSTRIELTVCDEQPCSNRTRLPTGLSNNQEYRETAEYFGLLANKRYGPVNTFQTDSIEKNREFFLNYIEKRIPHLDLKALLLAAQNTSQNEVVTGETLVDDRDPNFESTLPDVTEEDYDLESNVNRSILLDSDDDGEYLDANQTLLSVPDSNAEVEDLIKDFENPNLPDVIIPIISYRSYDIVLDHFWP